jgi:hypothetical protein
MTVPFPYSSPIILTDSIYISYGGETGTSTAAQRNAAYLLSEMMVSEALETYLLPITVTGTYLYNKLKPFVILDHTYLQTVNHVYFIDTEEHIYWDQAGTDNVYVSLRSHDYGLVDLHYLIGHCHCHTSSNPFPYEVDISYTAGMPTGTATKPDILLALSEYATIILNEITGFGNEAPGDIGVQDFQNQQYRETRVKLLRTAFGTSAKAQFIDKLLEKYKHRRWVGLSV